MKYLLSFNLFLLSVVSVLAQAPNNPASNLVLTNSSCNQISVSWVNGDGMSRAVFIKEISSFTNFPEFNTDYMASSTFGMGQSIKNDNQHFCVYNGMGNSVTISGLAPNHLYYIAVFEYNGGAGGGNTEYLTTLYPEINASTKNIVANFTVTGGRQQCLKTNNFKFTNKSTADISPITYSWYFGDGDSSNVKDPNHTYKTTGLMQVKLTARAGTCVSTIIMNDTVHPHPKASFDLDPAVSKNDATQCFYKNKFTFRNKTTLLDIGAGLSSMRYEWIDMTSGADLFGIAYKADRSFSTPGSKTIELLAVSNHGCRDSSVLINAYKVLPRSIDPTKVSVSPKSMPLKTNQFTFSNTSPLSVSHKWVLSSKIDPTFHDTVLGKAQAVNYSFTKANWYYITLESMDNATCVDKISDSVEVLKDAGAYNLFASSISIYPNPSKSGVFHINNLPANASISVCSIIGKEILNIEARQSSHTFDIASFGAGTYILSLSSEGKKFSYRLMVL